VKPSRIYLSVPHMSGNEQSFIADAFASNWLSSTGPNIDAFESEVAQRLAENVSTLAVSSGTAAIHLVLRAIGVATGDRVAVSTLTFAGSVWPIMYLGAQPVFIDSEAGSGNMDPGLVEDYFRASERTRTLPKALIVVHLYGQHADVDSIASICAKYGVVLVEDAAESLGAKYRGRQTGTTADYSILSFNGNKIITTTGGGMVVSRDSKALVVMRKWANQSREPSLEYLHRELGYNYRMSNLLAGIGRGQLRVLDQRVDERQRVAKRYRDALETMGGVELQREAPWGMHSRWLSVVFLDPIEHRITPAELVQSLEAQNIEARPVWRPMHTQPIFAGSQIIGGAVAERLYRTGLCLPSSSSLTDADQDRTIDSVRNCLGAEARNPQRASL
jgi:pyridoxal phosphate-dependent aminotransferase EpsN